MTENEAKELPTHFVYAGYYYYRWNVDRLRSFILEGMKKYNIKKVMVTSIYMWRNKLITKESMEKYCKGEKKEKDSVNDDLESLFEDLRLGKEPDEKEVWTYFLPKLTEEEMELVETKDPNYLQTFSNGDYADVEEAEMKLSESDSKFVEGYARRTTYTIENSSEQNIFNCCYTE